MPKNLILQYVLTTRLPIVRVFEARAKRDGNKKTLDPVIVQQ